ncbi:unnamed protein product [Dibothriocephalus latus]|uniref:Uncharacterized protein n=1 Tax=Dibothriocephalus latus TaxID=60516 RepID=A0A3P7LFL7_DIBLA|nr:unnamed protein product [Dibothriocephalus latus]
MVLHFLRLFLFRQPSCLSLSVDEQLLANETTARLLYAQALTDLRLGSRNPLPPLTPNFSDFPSEHLRSSTCWPSSVTLPESLPLEDIRLSIFLLLSLIPLRMLSLQATLHWCHTSVPLYGCMPVHFCLTTLRDSMVDAGFLSSNPTSPCLRPADVYVGRDALRVVLTGPFLPAATSVSTTKDAAANSCASEDQQHSVAVAYAGRNLISRAPHTAAAPTSPPTAVKSPQPADPLATRDDIQPSANGDSSTEVAVPRFFVAQLHQITITSDKQDQVRFPLSPLEIMSSRFSYFLFPLVSLTSLNSRYQTAEDMDPRPVCIHR